MNSPHHPHQEHHDVHQQRLLWFFSFCNQRSSSSSSSSGGSSTGGPSTTSTTKRSGSSRRKSNAANRNKFALQYQQQLQQQQRQSSNVFGRDLIEHTQSFSDDDSIPYIVKSCTRFIEKHGIIFGIYRLSGMRINIHKLRQDFDKNPKISMIDSESISNDAHAVACVLKQYFRELPTPLLTFHMYERFIELFKHCNQQDTIINSNDNNNNNNDNNDDSDTNNNTNSNNSKGHANLVSSSQRKLDRVSPTTAHDNLHNLHNHQNHHLQHPHQHHHQHHHHLRHQQHQHHSQQYPQHQPQTGGWPGDSGDLDSKSNIKTTPRSTPKQQSSAAILPIQVQPNQTRATQPLFTSSASDSQLLSLSSMVTTTNSDIKYQVKLEDLRQLLLELPRAHYETLKFLMRHLACIAANGEKTGMDSKNVAIVWAPNLLKPRELELSAGLETLQIIGLQAVITEQLIKHHKFLFGDDNEVTSTSSFSATQQDVELSERQKEQQQQQDTIPLGDDNDVKPMQEQADIDDDDDDDDELEESRSLKSAKTHDDKCLAEEATLVEPTSTQEKNDNAETVERPTSASSCMLQDELDRVTESPKLQISKDKER